MNNILSNLRYLLERCSKHEKLITQIHAHAITSGFLRNTQNFACKLLNTYAKTLNKPIEAHNIFNLIQNPDVISWTCLITLHLHTQRPFKALSIFSDMIMSNGLKPDGHCIVGALSACGATRNLMGGKIVHGMVLRFELGGEGPIVGNALIDMYSRNGRMHFAQKVFDEMVVKDVASWTSLVNGFIVCSDIVSAGQVFDEMPERSVISWTAMIVGYIRDKNPIRGLQLFREMTIGHIHPTSITIVAVLSGCADVGALDLAKSIHGYVNKVASLVNDVAVNNAMIDMYSKGGSLKMAKEIFREMPFKDVFSWTSVISGLALHGEGRFALEVFDDMSKHRLMPNEVTFVSVLSACGHAGLVEEGQYLFDRMINYYNFEPTIKHYGCMVDLRGRAGQLEEALELIKRMPMKPDAVIWRSVLNACLIKKDLELAQMAANKVLELEPFDDGVYILLWNMYRSTNKWEDALKTRKLMRTRNIKKQPGCSWIEVNGIVHEFTAEDSMHQLAIDVHSILEVLREQSRSVHDLSIL